MKYDVGKFAELFSASPGNEDSHYNGVIQQSHFSASNRFIFTLANITKYVDRYQDKGKPLLDLEKSLWYTKFQILDHDNFTIPVFSSRRITPEELFDVQDYSIDQKRVVNYVYRYNWSGAISHLWDVAIILELMIDELKCQE